jgi:hypothetical protein
MAARAYALARLQLSHGAMSLFSVAAYKAQRAARVAASLILIFYFRNTFAAARYLLVSNTYIGGVVDI